MYIKVTVVPGSMEEELKATADDSFIVRVREKPERGMANRRMIELMSAYFGKGKRIRIVSGHVSPRKIVSVG